VTHRVNTERRQKKHPNLRRGAPAKSTVQAPTDAAPAQPKNAKWKAGQSGNPAGRKKGVPTKATREVKALAQSILEDPVVQQRMLSDAQKGKLPPPVMTMLFHYAYGKPKDTLKVEGLERLEVIIKDSVDDEPELSDAEAESTRE
jgi:hypothetical protein